MGILQSVHDKGPSGSLTQVNFSAAQATSDLLNKAGVAQFVRLELRIAARGLPRKDKLRCATLFGAAVGGGSGSAQLYLTQRPCDRTWRGSRFGALLVAAPSRLLRPLGRAACAALAKGRCTACFLPFLSVLHWVKMQWLKILSSYRFTLCVRGPSPGHPLSPLQQIRPHGRHLHLPCYWHHRVEGGGPHRRDRQHTRWDACMTAGTCVSPPPSAANARSRGASSGVLSAIVAPLDSPSSPAPRTPPTPCRPAVCAPGAGAVHPECSAAHAHRAIRRRPPWPAGAAPPGIAGLHRWAAAVGAHRAPSPVSSLFRHLVCDA